MSTATIEGTQRDECRLKQLTQELSFQPLGRLTINPEGAEVIAQRVVDQVDDLHEAILYVCGDALLAYIERRYADVVLDRGGRLNVVIEDVIRDAVPDWATAEYHPETLEVHLHTRAGITCRACGKPGMFRHITP